MKKYLSALALLLLISGTAFGEPPASPAPPVDVTPQSYPLHEGKRLGLILSGDPSALHRVIIGYDAKPGASDEALIKRKGGKVGRTFRIVPAISATLPEAAIEAVLSSPGVKSIEADLKVRAIDAELDNAWGVKRIGAGEVHASGITGGGVKVAIVDSGIDYTHPDLAGVYAGGYDFANNDPYPMDDNGHGTHVSGTVAAMDNGAGVVGAAPGAQVYALKVLDAAGSGYFSDVIAALEWCADNRIQAANHSYGSGSNPGVSVQAAFDNAYAAGVLSVAAAGNSGNCNGSGDNVNYPANFASVMAVAATDSSDKRPCFSSTGPDVEISAPGVNINSTFPGGGYAVLSGTSMASPHVTGAAALLFSKGVADANQNGRTNDDARSMLVSTADDLGSSGRDALYGWGIVNAISATGISSPPAGSVNVGLSTNKAEYPDTDTVALLTAAVTDEGGAPIGGLASGAFETTLDGGPASAAFAEGTTAGTYTAALSIAGLSVGPHIAEVSAADSRGITGKGTAVFSITASNQPTSVSIRDIAYSTSGGKTKKKDLSVRMAAYNNLGSPVAGAAVSVDIYRGGVWASSGTGTTGADGSVKFTYRNAPAGCYETRVTAVTASGLSWDGATPSNSFCK